MANLFPSSFGFTCVVPAGTKALTVTATWGRYLKEKAEPTGEGDVRPGPVWRRHPAGGSTTVALAAGELGPAAVDSEQPDVVVRRGAAPTPAGAWLVTLFLHSTWPVLERGNHRSSCPRGVFAPCQGERPARPLPAPSASQMASAAREAKAVASSSHSSKPLAARE